MEQINFKKFNKEWANERREAAKKKEQKLEAVAPDEAGQEIAVYRKLYDELLPEFRAIENDLKEMEHPAEEAPIPSARLRSLKRLLVRYQVSGKLVIPEKEDVRYKEKKATSEEGLETSTESERSEPADAEHHSMAA